MIAPKRGGIHRAYGVYLGGCALDDDYKLTKARSFKYTTQLRNSKALASIEKTLMTARNDATSVKFNGKVELGTNVQTAELDKEQFVATLKDKVKFHGAQSFFYVPREDGTMTSLLEDFHNFTVDEVIAEHDSRKTEPTPVMVDGYETEFSKAERYRCYDEWEEDDFALSRLIVESLLTQKVRDNLDDRFSHYDDFDELPGQVIFMMTLDTVNASAEMDVEGAKTSFKSLKTSQQWQRLP